MRPEEQRRFPRIGLRAPLRWQIRGRPQFDNAITDNISEGGLSFTGNNFIAPDTTLMLELNVLSRVLRPVGRVTWAQDMAHTSRNRLGIQFLEIDPQEKVYLKDYIDMQKSI